MSKAKAAAQVESAKVGGVDVGKVDPTVLAKSLEGFGINVKAGTTLADMIAGLTEYVVKNYDPHTQCAQCDTCGAISPLDLTACPFCGVSDPEEDAQAGHVEQEPEEETQEEAGQEEAEAEVVEAPKKVGKKSKARHASEFAATEQASGVQKAAPSSPSMSLWIPTAPLKNEMDESHLDNITAKLLFLKSNLAANYWALGKGLKVVLDTTIWKVRTKGPEGKAKTAYTSFNQYCKVELKMSNSTCYDLMDAAAKFSEDQARRLGMTKLVLVMRAPENDQERLLEEAEKGATKSQIRDAVTRAKERVGHKRRKTGAGRKEMPSAGKQRVVGKVTVAMIEGRQKIAMVQKPDHKLAEGEEAKPCKRLADVPIAVEVLTNGVERTYSIISHPTSGQLLLLIETKRRD